MPICIICGAPNPDETDLRYFDLPKSTGNPEWHTRFMSELGIILESEQQLRDMKICENHFNPEDIVTENETYRLKENALPVNNLIDNFDHYYVRPELVYLNTEENTEEKNCEPKNLTDLNPLVVYTYKNEGSDEEKEDENYHDDDGKCIIKQEEEAEQTFDDQDQNVQDVINHVAGGGNGQLVEPIMPFFLSDPSVFAILNENNEVGETIIVQIENDPQRETLLEEEQEDVENDVKISRSRYEEFETNLPKLERSLCSSRDRNYSSTYDCDICDNSYGCMKCLKSHYESVHVSQLQIVHYKCQNSPNCPSGLYCPVCELVFPNRTATLDHYVTHYVACDICCSAFDRPMYLTKHMKAEHQKVDQNLDYECELCQNSYQYPSYLSKHYQIYHKMNLCITCKVRFKTVQELHEHEKIHIQKFDILPYACSRCDMAFPKISDITVHIRAVHKQTASENFVQSLGNKQYSGNPKQNETNVIQHSENVKQNPTKKVKVKK